MYHSCYSNSKYSDRAVIPNANGTTLAVLMSACCNESQIDNLVITSVAELLAVAVPVLVAEVEVTAMLAKSWR